jgi:hypothetical protein
MIKVPPIAPYCSLFDDAWLKWGWAVHHGVMLHAELKKALDAEVEGMFTTASEYHPEFHGFSIRVDSMRPHPATWGLMLGDVLHGYRSALDNAAWAAVQRGTRLAHLNDRERFKIAFPNPWEQTARAFNKSLGVKVPGAGKADIAVLRCAQPYHFSKRERARHVLPTLADKNNVDKHKTIQPVLLVSRGYIAGDIESRDCVVRRVVASHPDTLQVGIELARVYVRRAGPNPDIRVQAHLATTVFLDKDISIGAFLRDTRDWVAGVLRGFSECPHDLGERLGLVEVTIP